MKTADSPLVVAIASVSGGGKTTAVEQLVQYLPNTKALYFDQYDCAGPEDMMLWLKQGADNNEWNLQSLLLDLDNLLAEPHDCIVLDFPFADQHAQAKNYIDLSIFIDTPLDVALARRLLRDFSAASSEDILTNVQHYANKGRAAYLHMLSTIKPQSNLLIDGTLSISETVQLIAKNIERILQNK